VLTLCSLLSFPPLVYSQFRMMQGYDWLWWYGPFVGLSCICFLLPLLTDRLGRSFDLDRHLNLVSSWQPRRHPTVDVFLPVCGEPVEVLRNTWTHVARMCHHYPGKVTTYILDDGADPELKAMARTFGFAYATRPDRGWYKKSGNLLFGFEISDSEFILLLDADFAPRHDLLDEALPYLAAYPEIRHRADPAVLPHHRQADVGGAGRWRGAGDVLPLDPDGAGRQGRRYLLRELRRLPPDRAAGQPGHVAGGALGRPAHRL
jgi:cellulose synthase (UDP-forming)